MGNPQPFHLPEEPANDADVLEPWEIEFITKLAQADAARDYAALLLKRPLGGELWTTGA